MVKLIILDMDGVLFTRTKLSDKNSNRYDFIVKGYKYYIREGAKEFIDRLNELYDVCIFTSMYKSNAIDIIKRITKVRFKYILGREHTKLDPDYNKNPLIKEYDTIKLVSDVVNNPLINKDRKYNMDNTIIIDDSYLKIRFNNSKNVIIYNHNNDMYNNEYIYIGAYEEIMEYLSDK